MKIGLSLPEIETQEDNAYTNDSIEESLKLKRRISPRNTNSGLSTNLGLVGILDNVNQSVNVIIWFQFCAPMLDFGN